MQLQRYMPVQPSNSTQPITSHATSYVQQEARGFGESNKQAAQRSQTNLSGRYIWGSPWGCCVRCIDSSRPPSCRGGARGQISVLGHDLRSRVGCRQLTLSNNHLLHPSAHCKQLRHHSHPDSSFSLYACQTTQMLHCTAAVLEPVETAAEGEEQCQAARHCKPQMILDMHMNMRSKLLPAQQAQEEQS